jgi:hypothetical protein
VRRPDGGVGGSGGGGGGRGGGQQAGSAAVVVAAGGWHRWWAALVVVVEDLVVVVGSGGARAAGWCARCLGIAFFVLCNFICREQYLTPGTRVTSGSDVALGKGLFAGPAVPSALC